VYAGSEVVRVVSLRDDAFKQLDYGNDLRRCRMSRRQVARYVTHLPRQGLVSLKTRSALQRNVMERLTCRHNGWMIRSEIVSRV
jgi:hypothetical protein